MPSPMGGAWDSSPSPNRSALLVRRQTMTGRRQPADGRRAGNRIPDTGYRTPDTGFRSLPFSPAVLLDEPQVLLVFHALGGAGRDRA